jgi:hypothetical protein
MKKHLPLCLVLFFVIGIMCFPNPVLAQSVGTITVEKSGDTGTGFNFTSNITGNESFSLDSGDSVTFSDVPLGSYWITEDDPGPLYELTGLAVTSSYSTVSLDLPSRTINIDLADDDTVACDFINVLLSLPPEITVDNETVTVDEGQIAYNSGTWSDPDWVEEGSPSPYPYSWEDSEGNLFTVDATIGDILIGNRTWYWSYQTSDGSADSQTVAVTATDEYGLTDTASFDLVVNNVAPQVDPISVSDMFVPVGTMVDVSATFTDPGVLDTHIALWDWGDGSSDPVDPATSPVLGSHAYEESGVYTITLCITDNDGGQSCVTTDVYVLDDYVSGGGNINNPKTSVAGIVGNIDDRVAGQFHIVYHGKKGENTAYTCNNNFTSLAFSGAPIDGPQGPDSSASVATFIGTFVNDENPSDTFVATITITDVAEPGKKKDTIMIEGSPTLVDTSIKGGNFQVIAD